MTSTGLRRKVLAALVVVLGLGCPAAHAAPDTSTGAASGSDCPVVAGIFVPGTWETDAGAGADSARGLLAPVATSLVGEFGSRFRSVFVAYPARAMDGMAYGDSQSAGVAAAEQAVREIAGRCRATKFLLSGYSQGADVAGDLASAIGCHSDPIPPQRVLAVGLVADPRQGTTGGKLVGPAVAGTGIRGVRPEGFCELGAVTAQLCETGDRYCATDTATNPILTGLATTLTRPTTSAGASTTSTSSTSTTGAAANIVVEPSNPVGLNPAELTSGFTRQDLARLPADLTSLNTGIRSGRGSDPALAQTVASVNSVLTGLDALSSWAKSNPEVQQQLSGNDSPAHQQAARVLEAAGRTDLAGAVQALATITAHLGTPGAGLDSQVSAALTTLASATTGLTAPGTDALSQAGAVLSILKPSTVITQVATVASNTMSFAGNVPRILDTLGRIGPAVTDPNTDLAGKVRAAHEVFGQLNRLCEPLVRMAAGIDLSTVAGLLRLIPDPQGIAAVASLVVSVIARLDVVGLARQVGALQENLWTIAENLTGGADLLALGASFADLVGTLLGFAQVAVNTVIGSAAKTSPDLLDTTSDSTGATDLAGLSSALTSRGAIGGADALAQVAKEGLDAAGFYTSGAHQSYDTYVVDSAGRTALTWLADWFANRIRQVGA